MHGIKLGFCWNVQLLLCMVLMLGIFPPIATAVAAPVVEILHSFAENEGQDFENPIQDADGNLYGMTFGGGTNQHGTVFKLDTAGNYSILYSFSATSNGGTSLVLGSDGKLYGIDGYGTAGTQFEIFQLDITLPAPVYTVIHVFDDNVPPNLIQTKEGKLYGLADGVVFHLNTSGVAQVYTVLHEFDDINIEKVVPGSDGMLYALSYSTRGTQNEFRLHRLDVSRLIPVSTLEYTFTLDPNQQVTNIFQGSDGKFYGNIDRDQSRPPLFQATIFQLDISVATPVHTILHVFPDFVQGGVLFQGNDGKLYGVFGSSRDSIFQIDISGVVPAFNVFVESTNVRGTNVLMQENDGNIYGSSTLDGIFGLGFIYRIRMDIPVNTPPVATNDSFALTLAKRKSPITVAAPGVLGNDKDAEGKALAVVGATATAPKIIEFPQSGGKVALYADGHFVYTLGKKCFYGTRSFTYQATDGQETSSPATVTLTTKRRKHGHDRHESPRHEG